MRILVTGHKGFVGSSLVSKLREASHEVFGYDRGDKFPKVSVDVIYHLAANPKALASIKKPSLAKENIDITYKVLEWARKNDVKRVILASSVKADELKTPYGASKLISEILLKSYCKVYKMKGVVIRFSNIYGVNDREDRFIPTTIRLARENKDILIYGVDGHFITLDYAVKLYCRALFENVGTGEVKTFLVVAKRFELRLIAEKIVELIASHSDIKLDEGLRKVVSNNGES